MTFDSSSDSEMATARANAEKDVASGFNDLATRRSRRGNKRCFLPRTKVEGNVELDLDQSGDEGARAMMASLILRSNLLRVWQNGKMIIQHS